MKKIIGISIALITATGSLVASGYYSDYNL